MKSKIYILILLILTAPLFIHAKHFKVFDVSDGLCNNTVKCISQDKQGFVWFGTFDGLCRFDGVNFTTFRHNDADSLSITNNHVENILPVENGMWVGTEKGLNFYSYKENCFYSTEYFSPTEKKMIMNKAVRGIVKNDKNIYILDSTSKLFVWKGNLRFKAYMYELPFLAICKYKNGLLLAYTAKALYLLNPLKGSIVSSCHIKNEVRGNNICMYYSKTRDIVYVGLGIGYACKAFRIDTKYQTKKIKTDAPSDVKAIVDYQDKTIFGTDGSGLISISASKTERFTPNNSNISNDAIHSLFVDREKNLWAGTYRGGVNLHSTHYDWFSTLTMKNGQLTHNIVTAILPRDKKLYIGLDGGGINVYDTETGGVSSLTTRNSNIPGNNVLSVIGDDKYIWLGIYGKGLCRFSPSDRTFKTYSLSVNDSNTNPNYLWEIKDDNKGNIWLIGENIYIFNKKEKTFSEIKSLNHTYASTVVFEDNQIWISSVRNGLYKINSSTNRIAKHYSTESLNNPLASNAIRYLFVDSKHQIWFSAEYSGFYRLNEQTGKITSFGINNGLTDTNVTCMQEDSSGCLWLGTYNGLFRYDPSTETFIKFGKEDDLSSVQFNYNASFQKDSIMYFGSTNGLVYFNPGKIKYKQYFDYVYFTNLDILNEKGKSVHLYGEKPETVYLPYNQNFFTIHFAVSELTAPEKVNFSCYMKNFEGEWQEVSHDRQRSYTNVPPGEYYFYVRASDSNGKWSEQVSCLHIIITPPWWKTNGAIFLRSMLCVGFIALIFWFYRHELNIKHMVQLKEIEKNTAKSINEAKLSFYTNITHELRTPIFLITAPIEELLSSGRKVIQVQKSYLSTMYRNAIKLNKLIDRIIDFRKLEAGKLQLEKQRLNAVTFCKSLIDDYEALCQQKNIIFHFLPSKTIIQLDFDPEKMETILSNLISNAFKYTPEGGKIVLSIDETDNFVQFTVKDNGIGINEEYHEAIFDSFFQVNPLQTNSTGDGIGLSFVKYLVELHGGCVTVESKPNIGSKFIFNIPVSTEESNIIIPSPTIINKELLAKDRAASTPSPAATHTILIIDDEPEIVELLERTLINDFKILKAYNGVDGFALTQEHLPDIIICDIMMPKMSGTDFLSLVKGDKKISHIPIIMLTAKISEEDKIIAFDYGADAYLTKPVSIKYLRNRINNLLLRSESADATDLMSKKEKNYTKEEQRFLLKCKEIIDDNLTNREFDIIYFAEKMGMSHSALYKKVKAITGMSVIEFINEYRIFKAVQYFKEGENNISSVSLKCGFNDIKTFREAFKRKMQMSPKQYVQQL
ncbi:MAG: response regulator [Bacteroides sp.]|jgi:signal transduction histidine kinase/DNA-binding response OmpR family regulator/ligand-binding sensor domain-containing protein|nr:response regulator [Bacteroides sp.]MCI1683545.1 response regulator [Bacteroides sp.]